MVPSAQEVYCWHYKLEDAKEGGFGHPDDELSSPVLTGKLSGLVWTFT